MTSPAERHEQLSPMQKAVLALKELRAQLDALEQARSEPIAIVGLGCRFPGGADSPEHFWKLLHEGRDAICEVPPERWDLAEWHGTGPGKMIARQGGFLPELDRFDALFFGIAPREALTMDPQQRLLLEVCWEALENAGIAPDRLAGTPVGVFVGIAPNEYSRHVGDPCRIDSHVLTGNAVSVAVGRIAYLLGLQGPALAVDTACSSSLVAVHLACQALRNGECRAALAGGVNVLLAPESMVALSEMKALSPDGSCKTFDAAADGYGRGEGCGIVVLKRLSHARQDGDHVLALLRGSAVNHDGRSASLTAPNGAAQEAVIRQALAASRIEPSQVHYVEAHGTGTPLGDPIEVRALAAVFGSERPKDDPLLIGSVKTNLGHLEAAAGIAGLIKVVLALHHQEIPPHRYFKKPNPHLPWAELPVAVTAQATPWLKGAKPRLAGVSSFGFSGTNAHAVVEEASVLVLSAASDASVLQLLPLSARTEPALRQLAGRWAEYLAPHPTLALANIVYTAGVGRAALPHRLAVLAASTEEAVAKLMRFAETGESEGAIRGEARSNAAAVAAAPSAVPQEEHARRACLEDLARRFVRGESIGWQALHGAEPRRRLELPTYPFQRERFWIASSARQTHAAFVRAAPAKTGLHGQRLSSALRQFVFESLFELNLLPLLADHRVHGKVVVAGACHLALVLGALRETQASDGCTLRQVVFPQALFLPDDGASRVQAVFEDGGFQVFSSPAKAEGEDWTPHATGRYESASSAEPPAQWQTFRDVCREPIEADEFYRTLGEHGVELGPRFRWIAEAWRGEGEALCRMRAADLPEGDLAPLYPGLADSCVQAVILALPDSGVQPDPYIPVGVERLSFSGPPRSAVWAHARLHPRPVAIAEEFEGDVTLFEEDGRIVAYWEKLRFRRAPRELFLAAGSTRPAELFYELQWRKQEAAPKKPLSGRWLIVGDQTIGNELAGRLRSDGACCSVLPLWDSQPSIESWCAAEYGSPAGIVLIAEASIEELSLAQIEQEQWRLCQAVFQLVHVLARVTNPPRLWLVTRGCQDEASNPAAAPVWGIGRTIALEHPELRCTCIDLDPSRPGDECERLTREFVSEEPQVAFRGGSRHVARLAAADASLALEVPEIPYVLETASQGMLQSLTLRRLEAIAPAAYEIQTQVRATGLNFRDVLNALGLYPGEAGPLGLECAGTITAVGANVSGLQVGQDVIAMASGSFRSLVNTDARLAVPKPAAMSFEEGATIPVVFLTAHHAFQNLARLQPGERVLIHAAAGGVGLAALQLARRIGAEVYATASKPKHDFLRTLGVQHVFDSRSLSFADDVRNASSGQGVHVVLNSLAGEFIPASLDLLAQGGRFVEIGKTGIWDSERVRQRRADVSYFTLALDQMGVSDPGFVGTLLRELMPDFERGVLQPLKRHDFPLRRVREAFRFMAGGRHVGKIVVTQESTQTIRPDASYLITGGLGALGLETAKWLAERGAPQLVLVGRREPGADAREVIREMEMRGVRVLICQGDIAEEDAAGKIFAEVRSSCLPLRGIVHAAGVLDDGVLLEQTWERFEKVLAPKVSGAWNLHVLTREIPLDFFVLFSSAASLLGSAGQGSYAAANAFLDSLAQQRHALGLPATSINWGPWQEKGMAANLSEHQRQRMANQGLGTITTRQGLDALERILQGDKAQVAVLPLDRSRLPAVLPPLWSELRQDSAGGQSSEMLRRLEEAPAGSRRDLLAGFLREESLRILGLPPAHPLSNEQALSELGLDSLLAVELRNAVGAGLGRTLPATLLYNYPSIAALSDKLLEELFPAPVEQPPSPEDTMKEEIEQLSEDELDDLLSQFAGQHLKGTDV